jgi:hypothetical protein
LTQFGEIMSVSPMRSRIYIIWIILASV